MERKRSRSVAGRFRGRRWRAGRRRGSRGNQRAAVRFEQLEPRIMLTEWCGHITANTVWDDLQDDYTITCNLTVDAGVTLTVQPGVRVVSDYGGLFIDGHLAATGSDFSGAPQLNVRQGGRLDLIDSAMSGSGHVRYFGDSAGSVTDSRFGDQVQLWIDRAGVAVDGTEFQGSEPVVTLPSGVADLADNQFTYSPGATIAVTGYTAADVTWQEIENVQRIRVLNNIWVAAEHTLAIEPGVEVYSAAGVIAVYGVLNATGVDFTGDPNIYVVSGGELNLVDCTLAGRREVRYYSSASGSVVGSQFGERTVLRIESPNVTVDGSVFTGAEPVVTLPSGVVDLMDNQFVHAGGATIAVTGYSAADAIWQPWDNVRRFRILYNAWIAAEHTVTIAPGAEVVANPGTLAIYGVLDASGVAFTGHPSMYVQNGGELNLVDCTLAGTNEVRYYGSATGSVVRTEFGPQISLRIESANVTVDQSVFAGGDPVIVLPSGVPELADNRFVHPDGATIGVTGYSAADAVWQPLDNVRRYRILYNAWIAAGHTVAVEPGVEVYADPGTLSIYGVLHATGVDFTGHPSMYVQSGGRLDLVDCTVAGQNEVRYYSSATGAVLRTEFGEQIQLRVESANVTVDQSVFAAADPVIVLPSGVPDLADNQFVHTGGATIGVTGYSAGDASWQKLAGVRRYRILNNAWIAAAHTLSIEPGVEVYSDPGTVSIYGTVHAAGVDFTGDASMYVQNRGQLDLTDCTLAGQREVRYYGGSAGEIHGSEFGAQLTVDIAAAVALADGENFFRQVQATGSGAGGATIDMRGNYWGTWNTVSGEETRQQIESQILHHADEAGRPEVLFESWLGLPPHGFLGVTGHSPDGELGGTIDAIDVMFSKPIDPRSFSAADIAITTPAGPLGSSAVQGIEPLSAHSYRIHFVPQSAAGAGAGSYAVRTGSAVTDVGGAPLDQSGNLMPGESVDVYTASFTLRPVDLTVSRVAVQESTWWAGRTVHVSWDVTNQSGLDVLGSWTDSVYLSADESWDASDRLLLQVEHGGGMAAGAGSGYSQPPLEVLLPGVLPADYHLTVRADLQNHAPQAGVESSNVQRIGPQAVQIASVPSDGTPSQAVLSPTDPYEYFVVHLAPHQVLHLDLNGHSSTAENELYVSRDRLPVRVGDPFAPANYDYRVANHTADAQLAIPPQTAASDLYVLIVAGQVDSPFSYELTAYATTVPPDVVGYAPHGTTLPGVSQLQIQFDRPMDSSTFNPQSDVLEFVGPGGAIPITGQAWPDPLTLVLSFAPQFSAGNYRLRLGPHIRDTGGHDIDHDHDYVSGEETADSVTMSFNVALHGELTSDTTMTPESGVITIDGLLTVAAGVTLTIDAGTIIKFDGGSAGLRVLGKLAVKGTVAAPVIFTSYRDDSAGGDTNGDQGVTGPQAGDWAGIAFRGPVAEGVLNHVQISYAWRAVDADDDGVRVTLNNAVLRYGDYGLYTYSPFVEIQATNCLIHHFSVGVHMRADSRGTYRNCTLADNTTGIHLGGATLTLENTIVAFNGTGLDHSGDPPSVTVRYSDFYNPSGRDVRWNGDPGEPDLAAAGNQTRDPLFVDRAGGDYRLRESSPAIDAGLGDRAPGTDLRGRGRYDDRGVANVGAGVPTYVDLGVFERQSASPARNLAVRDVRLTAAATVSAGDPISIDWEVANVGDQRVAGPWRDTVYLSVDPYLDPARDVLLYEQEHASGLAAGKSYAATWTGSVPSGVAGPLYVLAYTNSSATDREADLRDNVRVAKTQLAVAVPVLATGAAQPGTLVPGRWTVFQFEAEAGRSVQFSAELEDYASGAFGLYVQRGVAPSLASTQVVAHVSGQDHAEVYLQEPAGTTYYVGVYAAWLATGSTGLVVRARPTSLRITDVEPQELGLGGRGTLEIRGEDFAVGATVTLVSSADESQTLAASVRRGDAGTLFATVNVPDNMDWSGVYDVQVANPDATQTGLPHSVSLVAREDVGLAAQLIVPGLARPGRVVTVQVEYVNQGSVDLESPLLHLQAADDFAWQVVGSERWVTGADFYLLGLSSQGSPTTLRPGQRESVEISVRLPFREGVHPIQLASIGAELDDGSSALIEWSELEPLLRPAGISDEQWSVAWRKLQARLGPTWGDYVAVLRENTERWWAAGQYVACVRQLLDMEVDAALGQPDRILQGRVIDANGGDGLVGVEVVAASVDGRGYAAGMTDEFGYFAVYGLEDGAVEISVPGFVMDDGHADVHEIFVAGDMLGISIDVRAAASIRGVLTDAATSLPITGGTVTVYSAETSYLGFTDADGMYEIDGVPLGEYTVVAQAGGYLPERMLRVRVTSVATLDNLDFTLEVGGSIRGRVTSAATGLGLADVWLVASSDTAVTHVGLSDETGDFEIVGLESGQWTVGAWSKEYLAGESAVVSVAEGAVTEFSLSMRPGGSLFGLVSDAQGQPVVGATVVATTLVGQRELGVTDEAGRYLLSPMASGDYTIEVTGARLAPSVIPGVVLTADAQHREVNVDVFPESTVGIHVSDAAGSDPVVGAAVTLYSAAGEAFLADAVSAGNYTVGRLVPGVYTVMGSADGYATTQHMLEITDRGSHTDLGVTLSQAVPGKGMVTLADGVTPVAEALVFLVSSEGVTVGQTKSDADGWYGFNGVLPGMYRLAALHEQLAFAPIDVVVGNSAFRNDLAAGGEMLSGSVLDDTTGGPLANADVIAYRAEEDASDWNVVRTVTNAAGEYVFSSLLAGRYWVVVSGPSASRAASYVFVESDNPAVGDVRIAEGVTYAGVVRDASDQTPIAGATVLFRAADAAAHDPGVRVETNDLGGFSTSVLPAGTYQVLIRKSGFAPEARQVELSHDLVGETISLEQGPADIEVHATDLATGLPLPAAMVIVSRDGYTLASGTTGDDGELALAGIPAGNAVITAFGRSGRTSVPVSIPAGTEEFTIPIALPTLANADRNANLGLSMFGGGSDGEGRLALFSFWPFGGDEPVWERTDPPYDGPVHFPTGLEDLHAPMVAVCSRGGYGGKSLDERQHAIRDKWYGKSGAEDTGLHSTHFRLNYLYERLVMLEREDQHLDEDSDESTHGLVNSLATLATRGIAIRQEHVLAGAGERLSAAQAHQLDEVIDAAHAGHAALEGHNFEALATAATALVEVGATIAGYAAVAEVAFFVGLGLLAKNVGQSARGVYDAYVDQKDLTAEYGRLREEYEQLLADNQDAFEKYREKLTEYEHFAAKDCCWYYTNQDGTFTYRDPLGEVQEKLGIFKSPCESPPKPDDKKKDEEPIPAYPSYTPEDKFGPAGFDLPATPVGSELRFINGDGPLTYRIEFWNEVDAIVPTQDAVIIDYLDPAVFDVETMQLTRVGFLSWDVPLAGGQALQMRVDPQPELNFVVDVSATFGPATYLVDPAYEGFYQIEWQFLCLDPLTGDYPADPLAGFLPAFNPETRYELGWVEFSVELLANLPSGTAVQNQAFVDFDSLAKPDPYENLLQHPAPKPGPWINTLDLLPPESEVEPLPEASPLSFPVRWGGNDGVNGAGIAHYDVYVADDHGGYSLWLEETTSTSGVYPGQDGHTYSFYSVATDYLAHRELPPITWDTETVADADVLAWRNAAQPLDVNADGKVRAQDALLVINELVATRYSDPDSRWLPTTRPADNPNAPYFDVSGDQRVTPRDALLIINYLSRLPAAAGEGEAAYVPVELPVPQPGLAGNLPAPDGWTGAERGDARDPVAIRPAGDFVAADSDSATAALWPDMGEDRWGAEVELASIARHEVLRRARAALRPQDDELETVLDAIGEDIAGSESWGRFRVR